MLKKNLKEKFHCNLFPRDLSRRDVTLKREEEDESQA